MKTSTFSGFIAIALVGCGSSNPTSPTATGYRIVSVDGTPLTAVVGEAKRLALVQVLSDGSTMALGTSTAVTWSGPPVGKALAAGSTPDSSILPQPGPAATAMWIQNTEHYTDDELAGVLWVLDMGSDPHPAVTVTASLPAGEATVIIGIGPMPTGDAVRGKSTYEANCSSCHGATGQGTAQFPGLDNAPDHLAGDPGWNASLMAISARSDMDNLGVSLDVSMPKWLTRPSSTGQLLSTADFADLYAFLKTQTE